MYLAMFAGARGNPGMVPRNKWQPVAYLLHGRLRTRYLFMQKRAPHHILRRYIFPAGASGF